MRHLALVALLFGVGAVVYAGIEYTSGDPEGEGENSSATALVVPLAFATSMAVGGMLLWVVGGKGNSEAKGNTIRPRVGTPEDRAAARAKSDRLP
jgi:hypothetical protein